MKPLICCLILLLFPLIVTDPRPNPTLDKGKEQTLLYEAREEAIDVTFHLPSRTEVL